MIAKCEVYAPLSCQDPVAWRIIYYRRCTCWPQEKFFCQFHGTVVASQWEPPDDEGSCPECSQSIRFVIMEPT